MLFFFLSPLLPRREIDLSPASPECWLPGPTDLFRTHSWALGSNGWARCELRLLETPLMSYRSYPTRIPIGRSFSGKANHIVLWNRVIWLRCQSRKWILSARDEDWNYCRLKDHIPVASLPMESAFSIVYIDRNLLRNEVVDAAVHSRLWKSRSFPSCTILIVLSSSNHENTRISNHCTLEASSLNLFGRVWWMPPVPYIETTAYCFCFLGKQVRFYFSWRDMEALVLNYPGKSRLFDSEVTKKSTGFGKDSKKSVS